jgi:hypothetical protein
MASCSIAAPSSRGEGYTWVYSALKSGVNGPKNFKFDGLLIAIESNSDHQVRWLGGKYWINEPSVDDFLTYCYDLVVQFVHLEKVKSNLPTYIDSQFANTENAKLLDSFQTAGMIAYLAAAIARWRATPASLQSGLSQNPGEDRNVVMVGDLGNPPGIITIDGLKAYLKESIANLPNRLVLGNPAKATDIDNDSLLTTIQRSGDLWWRPVLERGLQKALSDTADDLLTSNLQLDPEHGIEVVDRALKQLAGYITMRKWKLPEIARSSL